MPIPRSIARFNRVATNRLGGPLAGWMPGFAVIEHRGRSSGRRYRTPVAAFRSGAAFTVALTYGTGSDWVQNVLAAGGCAARSRRRTLTLVQPRLVHDEARRGLPAPVRLTLGLLGVSDFLQLSIDDTGDGRPAPAAR